MKKNKRAFTLIELLVVVLIIGILSAIALPQYNKAVEKTRTTEAQLILSSVSRAVDEYLLANGLPASGQIELLSSSTNANGQVGVLSVDAESQLACTPDPGFCAGKHFVYDSYCQSAFCVVRAKRYLKSDFSDRNSHYQFVRRWSATNGVWKWQNECYILGDLGVKICGMLGAEGWSVGDLR